MIMQMQGATTIASFKTVEEATESTGARNISKVLKGDFKTSSGYAWKEQENMPECPVKRFVDGVDAITNQVNNNIDEMVDTIMERM